jgi:hypothetical protein
MNPIADSQRMQSIRLDCALSYAVIQSWDQLMPDPTSGLIHIEYQTGENGSTDFLKFWASTIRGSWKLVCEFWIRPLWSHTAGLRFDNGCQSEDFAHNLECVMGEEETLPKLPERVGLIQISAPTQDERREADRWIKLTFNQPSGVVKQSVAV